jgi:hypothetical protein
MHSWGRVSFVTDRNRDSAAATDIVGAVLLTMLIVPVAAVFTGIVVLSSFRADACSSQSCDLAAGQASIFVTPIAGVVAIALSVVWAVLRARTRNSLWLPPVIGILLVGLGFAIALIINTVALTPA